MEAHVKNLKQELQTKTADVKQLTERVNYLEHDQKQV